MATTAKKKVLSSHNGVEYTSPGPGYKFYPADADEPIRTRVNKDFISYDSDHPLLVEEVGSRDALGNDKFLPVSDIVYTSPPTYRHGTVVRKYRACGDVHTEERLSVWLESVTPVWVKL
jgi:hypothetical protein